MVHGQNGTAPNHKVQLQLVNPTQNHNFKIRCENVNLAENLLKN